jgi:hypothetical protein
MKGSEGWNVGMKSERGNQSAAMVREKLSSPATPGRRTTWLDDPRAVDILTTELEQYFVTGRDPDADRGALQHGSPQRLRNLASSLTTTSGVVAALNSVLAGALAGDVGALAGAGPLLATAIGAGVSLVSALLHVRYAARFRRSHAPAVPDAIGQEGNS